MTQPPAIVTLLADDLRWQLVRELAASDRSVRELTRRLGAPQSLVSYHLGVLRAAGLVRVQRSTADGRASYYALHHQQLEEALAALPHHLQPHEPAPGRVLVVCTHNQARSPMAEGWLRTLSQGQLRVTSAGVAPRSLHPLTLQVMAEVGVDLRDHRPRHLSAALAEPPDLVLTVCDQAREQCMPLLSCRQIHWSLPSPAAAPPAEQLAAFRAIRDELRQRVERLLARWGWESASAHPQRRAGTVAAPEEPTFGTPA